MKYICGRRLEREGKGLSQLILMASARTSFLSRLKRKIFRYILFVVAVWGMYYWTWGQYVYLVTAYCDCPICINITPYQDGRFASGKQVYWGGVAVDPKISFGSEVELVPHWPQDWFAVFGLLKGRRDFIAEDRGGKIKEKHIDLFISDQLGGHEKAKEWGVRKMRIRINGVLAK